MTQQHTTIDHDQEAQSILEGQWPQGVLDKDDIVRVINAAGEILANSEDDDQANNLFKWLGGCERDLMLYGFQLVVKRHQLDVELDETSEVRVAVIGDRLDTETGYEADNFNDINHYAWPRQYADGSTFEDRLDELIEELCEPSVPSDLLLNGVGIQEDLDFNQRFQIAQDCVTSLTQLYNQYQKPNVLVDERAGRFITWLLGVEDEIALYSIRVLLGGNHVVLGKDVKNLDAFLERHGSMAARV